MMMPAAPGAAFEVIETELVLLSSRFAVWRVRHPDDPVFPVALVDELLECVDIILLRSVEGTQSLGHRLNALPLTVEQKPAQIRYAPELPLAATEARRDVGHVRLEVLLQFLQISCLHAPDSEVETDLAEDRLNVVVLGWAIQLSSFVIPGINWNAPRVIECECLIR